MAAAGPDLVKREDGRRARGPDHGQVTALHKATQSVPIEDLKTARLQVGVADTRAILGVRVHVDLEHTWTGDLTVRLKPQAGTGIASVLLHERQGGGTANVHRSFALELEL